MLYTLAALYLAELLFTVTELSGAGIFDAAGLYMLVA